MNRRPTARRTVIDPQHHSRSAEGGVAVAEAATAVADVVHREVLGQPVWDVHTHLYPPSFGTGGEGDGLLLWGIDELLTYHYLVAEVFRVRPAPGFPYEHFWRMSKNEQADHIWKYLFLEASPISEACRGVLTALRRLGLDTSERKLDDYRRWFAEQDIDQHIDRVMELAGVSKITMTNAVFDDHERKRWLDNPDVGSDSRFAGVLRLDPLIRDWPTSAKKLTEWGYAVNSHLDEATIQRAQQFVSDWLDRVQAIYCAVSLPPEFRFQGADDSSVGGMVLRKVLLPVLARRELPLALMLGARLGVNPSLRDAGDMGDRSDIESLVRLCADFPENRFLCTMLSRENQHDLAVVARKFGNLMIFGCWWFLNNPSLVDEITRMRVELLGTSFIPQHSDARVLEQLIYKWDHSRELITKVLTEKYEDLAATGWEVREADVQRDVKRLFHDNLAAFLAGASV